MNQSELDKIRHIHETKGLQLNTASGLSGTIYDADRSATGPVTALLDECSRSFDKDAEISRLSAQVKDLTEALQIRDTTIEDCARVAEECEITLVKYPDDQARTYYESAVMDASMNIAKNIRALKDKNPREE